MVKITFMDGEVKVFKNYENWSIEEGYLEIDLEKKDFYFPLHNIKSIEFTADAEDDDEPKQIKQMLNKKKHSWWLGTNI